MEWRIDSYDPTKGSTPGTADNLPTHRGFLKEDASPSGMPPVNVDSVFFTVILTDLKVHVLVVAHEDRRRAESKEPKRRRRCAVRDPFQDNPIQSHVGSG
jgi:hypothetical protein